MNSIKRWHWILGHSVLVCICLLGGQGCSTEAPPQNLPLANTQKDIRHDHQHLHGDGHRHDHRHEGFVGAHAHDHDHRHRHTDGPNGGTIFEVRRETTSQAASALPSKPSRLHVEWTDGPAADASFILLIERNDGTWETADCAQEVVEVSVLQEVDSLPSTLRLEADRKPNSRSFRLNWPTALADSQPFSVEVGPIEYQQERFFFTVEPELALK